MFLLGLIGLGISFISNLLASNSGYKNYHGGDKDLLLPMASLIFVFYPIVISLPEAHYKFINFHFEEGGKNKQESELYPFAFLICLLSITICMIVDHFCLRSSDNELDDEKEELKQPNKMSIQCLLSLSIAFQNMVNFYFICKQDNSSQLIKEMFLFLVFSLFVNFSFSYLLAWVKVDQTMNLHLSIFINLGLVVGFILSFILNPDIIILILPCCCAGIQIYCSMLLCFRFVFTNGEKPREDKYRFGSICIALLLMIIYYPICYLLRI